MAEAGKTEEVDESIKGRLTRMEAVVTELDEDFEAVRARLDGLAERVEGIEEKLSIEGPPDTGESTEETPEKGNEVVGLDELEGRVDAIEEALGDVDVENLESRVEEIDGRVDHLEGEVGS